MRVDVRPHNDVRRLFISFGVSFLVVHQIVVSVINFSSSHPSSSSSSSSSSSPRHPAAGAKTCVETKENGYHCADDPKEARKGSRRRALRYYLTNFGVRQSLAGSVDERVAIDEVVVRMEDYMRRWIVKHDHDESAKENCINKHDKCAFWASIDECIKNPGFMETECALACRSCHKLLEEIVVL